METERLLLRPWRPDDIEALAALFAEPATWCYPFGRGLTREESARFLDRQIRHWETHGFGPWAAELRAQEELIGYIGLAVPMWLPEVLPAVEVGWRLHPSWWGRGLATEGGRTSLRHGFEVLQLDRIIGIFMSENVASGRVMTKLGMHDCLTTKDPRHGFTLQVREITVGEWEQTGRGRWASTR
ncbi:MAG: GNAT family N-acetyltransferase [Actinomycetota bacterium]|nr:GNAT family N-acetyltransferase [Actinomycetota bacterium]